jgi:TPR repeat protein
VAESCDDAANRLFRIGATIIEKLRKVEIKPEIRKRYLFLESSSSDEDVVQYHEYAATAGDIGSQITMGDLNLLAGHGLSRSFEKAFEYYDMAAQQENMRAVAKVAFMYEKGYGVEQDSKQALQLYKQSAKKEDAFGLARLGFVYLFGKLGVLKDLHEAEQLFLRASKAGAPSAWLGLGYIAQSKGDGKKALKYFGLAGQKGSSFAAYEMARIQVHDPTLCLVAVRNLAMVMEWSEGVVQLLTKAYKEVKGEGNLAGALEIYEQLAWAGVEEAQANAAYIHHIIYNDFEKARLYYELSAEQRNSHSHLMLGNYYYYNVKNLNISHVAYRRASDLHHHEAMFNLGYMYQHGEGTPVPDPHLAKRYYDLALATNPASVYAVYLSRLHLMLTTGSIPWTGLDLWFVNDSLVITLLVVMFTTLLLVRNRNH